MFTVVAGGDFVYTLGSSLNNLLFQCCIMTCIATEYVNYQATLIDSKIFGNLMPLSKTKWKYNTFI